MKTTRRGFITRSVKAATVTALSVPIISQLAQAGSKINAFEFSQIKLPYSFDALEPFIDKQTMELHYGKHHAAYLKNVNEAIVSEKVNYSSEREYFSNTSKLSAKIRNNAGGVWNHNFFWQIMKPAQGVNPSGVNPSGKLAESLKNSFGSIEEFKEKFTQAGMSRFGSGWAWLVKDNDKLKIGSTPNQDNPLMDASEFKGTPLLGLDVWEHAYYLKYQNKRNEYISNWWNVVNWDEVAKNLG